jgi:hypothetical protein
MNDDYPLLRWLVIIGVAVLVLVQCNSVMDSPPSGPYYGPDCVVVYYSNGPMCE